MEKIIAHINDTNIWLPFEEFESKMNVAGKAIVIDNNDHIAIIHSKKYWWYKLPWWHIDDWENEQEAVIRECKEEIWCDIAIKKKIGIIIEERFREKYKKISHYFICFIQWEKGEPNFMKSEIDEELEILRIPTYNLVEKFNQKDGKNQERIFVQLRDQYVIQEFINKYSSVH